MICFFLSCFNFFKTFDFLFKFIFPPRESISPSWLGFTIPLDDRWLRSGRSVRRSSDLFFHSTRAVHRLRFLHRRVFSIFPNHFQHTTVVFGIIWKNVTTIIIVSFNHCLTRVRNTTISKQKCLPLKFVLLPKSAEREPFCSWYSPFLRFWYNLQFGDFPTQLDFWHNVVH